MKGKGKSNMMMEMDKLEKMIYDEIENTNKSQDEFYIPENKYNPDDSTQIFYKMFARHSSGQVILKHGHKVFHLSNH